MRFDDQAAAESGSIPHINDRYLADEARLVSELADYADPGETGRQFIRETAVTLVRAVRRNKAREGGLDAFLQQYDLSSEEGVLLMCIAEALLRIPDPDTADQLIADKLTSARWRDHLGTSDSLFVNASTWGLMLTGELLRVDEDVKKNPARRLAGLAGRAGEPVVRAAMRQAMRIMGHQFVMGRDIDEALERAARKRNRAYRYSFDMLGEAALTATDAERYFAAYLDAIDSIGDYPHVGDIFAAPGISVKLSALHPRYTYTHRDRVMAELVPRLLQLTERAKEVGIALTVDAEEADRLELSLELFAAVMRSRTLGDYDGFGLAVQTYQRRAQDVFAFLETLAEETKRRIPVRLVKGAYWDTEIKRAQEQGLSSYPVFTRKEHTDVSYLACARRVLDGGDAFYPQFATHNAHTLASILHYADGRRDYEFQRLHGMGEELYAEIVPEDKMNRPCRVYAPVGSHEDLLPYLVRRLLENGANTSFVHRILDESIDIEDIVQDPIATSRGHDCKPHARIPSPPDLFAPGRKNSAGVNLADRSVTAGLLGDMQAAMAADFEAGPVVGGMRKSGEPVPSVNPADTEETVGTCIWSEPGHVDEALSSAAAAQRGWDRRPADERAGILEQAADLYEAHMPELLALCVAEAGKTIPDAVAEVREAVDFMRYYAQQARALFEVPTVLPGPTGERNTLSLRGRGVFVCISPWNFPLAIFTGQVSAALAAGNAVLAKPAEQTPLVAHRGFELMIEAGVPPDVLHFLPGDGAAIGGRAVADPRVAGVAFTGSTDTARRINRALAERDGPIAAFIAETGGQNAMFVDSSALPEQVVLDSVFSAFNSAGQRCSALRLMCVQRDIAPRIVELLTGHMDELSIDRPEYLSTDVGPAIDAEARDMLDSHVSRITADSELLHRSSVPEKLEHGTFFPPTLIEVDDVGRLETEVFGPVLHLLRYRGRDLEKMVEAVNATGYGLTMGLHSRIDIRARRVAEWTAAGNFYINRNMVGAVVGVQPFGGSGLSGTGPKAGGPHYLPRFATERTVSNNIAAVGGNASLLSLASD